MRHPIWAINMFTIEEWNDSASDIFVPLAFWCPFINEWLDKTRVKENPDARALVRVLHKLFRRHVDWSKLGPSEEGSVVQKICSVDRRLSGLLYGRA